MPFPLSRMARWEVEKNLSRLAADWRYRVACGTSALIDRLKDKPWTS